uniref:Uncharacterized protein n=1 Tax=Rhipicephalus microplus TaxID=6941 RepID=A0A6G5A4R3_RHIMP
MFKLDVILRALFSLESGLRTSLASGPSSYFRNLERAAPHTLVVGPKRVNFLSPAAAVEIRLAKQVRCVVEPAWHIILATTGVWLQPAFVLDHLICRVVLLVLVSFVLLRLGCFCQCQAYD